MVKSFVPVNYDAQYESQQRTVGVSSKPAIGKELFSTYDSDAGEHGSNSFKGQFETERYIHGKVREFLLRSSARLNRVHGSDVHAGNSSHSTDDFVHSSSSVSDSLRFRMVAKAISSSSSLHLEELLSIPKGIRENVMAQLLRDSHFAELVLSSSANVGNNSTVPARAGNGKYDLRDLLSDSLWFGAEESHANGLRKLDSSSNVASRQNLLSLSRFLSVVYLMIVDGLLNSNDNSQPANSSDSNTSWQRSCRKLAERRAVDDLKNAAGYFSTMKQERGFGTAPIWYQQSMETGPPTPNILAGAPQKMYGCMKNGLA